MPTRNVVLTDYQSDLIDRLVASGRYQNASEAMRAGLRALEQDESRLARLNARLEAGLHEIETGNVHSGTPDALVSQAGDAARRRIATRDTE